MRSSRIASNTTEASSDCGTPSISALVIGGTQGGEGALANVDHPVWDGWSVLV